MAKCDKLVIGGGMGVTFLKDKGVNFILPTDVVLADKFAADANTKVAKVEDIPDGWMGLDNGPESTKMIQKELEECKTIIWNGPMGVFEMEKAGLAEKMSHISTGGGASLE